MTEAFSNVRVMYTAASPTTKSHNKKLDMQVHGNEKLSVWGLTQYIKDLCENWQMKPELEFIRCNLELIVIPIINVSGYDANTRVNANGVDLNRNFPEGWKSSDPASVNYSGPEPASEVETQLMMSFIEENNNAEYMIDFHNFYQRESRVLWTPTNKVETKQIAMNTIATVARKWRQEYDFVPKTEPFGYVSSLAAATMFRWAESIGMKTILAETARQIDYAPNAKHYDDLASKLSVDYLGNILVTIAKSFI